MILFIIEVTVKVRRKNRMKEKIDKEDAVKIYSPNMLHKNNIKAITDSVETSGNEDVKIYNGISKKPF